MKYGLFFYLLLTAKAFALYGRVAPSKAPFMASLSSGNMRCNGVLISSKLLLTAGHCIDRMSGKNYGYSHALIYEPHLLQVKIGKTFRRVQSVTYSSNYFDGTGYETQDLALIELKYPVTDVKPIKIASRDEISPKTPVTLMTTDEEVETSLISISKYSETTVLWLAKTGSACSGDSGGAVVLKINGEQKLAGILMYNGSGCGPKTGHAYFPKGQF